MVKTERARGEKSPMRPAGETRVRPNDLSSGLERVREAVERDPQTRFTPLFHHITVDLLRGSYRQLNPKAASGVDGVT